MSVYTYKRPGWMKLAQQKRVNLAQCYSLGQRTALKPPFKGLHSTCTHEFSAE
jgi:hypothetical protein